MTDTPQTARDDTTAIGAYAAGYQLDAEAAAVEWRFLVEAERERWRGIAAGQAAAAVRGPACEALDAIDPGKLDMLADWLDLDDRRKGRSGPPEVQADLRRWAQLVREEQLWRLSPDGDGQSPAYWHVRAALTSAVTALSLVSVCDHDGLAPKGGFAELAAMARDALARVDKINRGDSEADVSTRALAYAEDQEADEITAEDDAEPEAAPEHAALMAENNELRHLNAAQGFEVGRLRGLLAKAGISDPGDGGALKAAVRSAAEGGE